MAGGGKRRIVGKRHGPEVSRKPWNLEFGGIDAAYHDRTVWGYFDPLGKNTSSSESGDSDGSGDEGGLAHRIGHADWCSCGRCVPMDTEHESACCR
ncbi:hypothetical protein HPB52_004680 [Rhipicephalus sanguineus]|uniref:P2X purinoreceptor 7 intracellular domain-containing protein n=1 Tax=Rhipicephalus sanguineus TaxID=34632 RepID=A0A9D4QHG4_RHISA|nr:hypothetical protein HPB52_004680 [Rhipicephalus sanguineus]